MSSKRVVIIGAGPAGLTAALELLRGGDAHPVVLESSHEVGGISRTVNYRGNRMDIGGHRFFSKSDWVMQWWQAILPIAHEQGDGQGAGELTISYQGQHRSLALEPGVAEGDRVMLVRNRLSRIYFLRKYFDYPIRLNWTTLSNLGVWRLLRIGLSYLWSTLFPRRVVRSLEDFLVNRFGGELYRTFFKDYTEKVWGVACDRISAEWGAQRIKGLSIMQALLHALRRLFFGQSAVATKTSLIEKFLYPRLGPGQLWEEVARQVVAGGGEIHFGQNVSGLEHDGKRVLKLCAVGASGIPQTFEGDAFISTMPVKDLVLGMNPPAPEAVKEIAGALPYRDFISVGLLVSKMLRNVQAQSEHVANMPPDNWIYIQERDVKIGRLQIFNNWSPDLVADAKNIWLGLEYFCQEGDSLWALSDTEMLALASAELSRIGMIDSADVLDGTVLRVPKTYPAYFGAYEQFPVVRNWLDVFENLYLVGRNGMHRYNNQDHSMLTAKLAVEAILAGSTDKSAIWAVNVDDDYHEESSEQALANEHQK